MKERPIIFNGPMVRAIPACRKTMTRRIINPQPEGAEYWTCFENKDFYPNRSNANPKRLICSFGVPGDRLWVRETFCAWGEPATDREGVYYRADGEFMAGGRFVHELKWTPSIHMPRWASRITLEITSVRVERLQEISEEDARAEGAITEYPTGGDCEFPYRLGFMNLWKSIYGPDSWAKDPWVWVISFKELWPLPSEGEGD